MPWKCNHPDLANEGPCPECDRRAIEEAMAHANRSDKGSLSSATLMEILAPRCAYCGHFLANHVGDKGCTSIKAHEDDGDLQPCGCGGFPAQDPLLRIPVPLRGICSRCGDILHDGDATICEICRGHRGEPYPEGEED